METYRCAYRDPQSPLTPLTPVCDVTLRETLRDHSPTLVPIKNIVLDKCPPPKKKRSSESLNKKSPLVRTPCPVNIVVSSAKTPPSSVSSKKSTYLQHLRQIFTPNSRPRPKSMEFAPICDGKTAKSSRFTCYQKPSITPPMPTSPRVLKILQDIGQDKYSETFGKEEIDLEVFKILTKHDLMKLGVRDDNDVSVLLKAIRSVQNW